MFKIYQYRDKPILNIEKWAYDHNEKMVDIIWKIKQINPYAKKTKNIISFYKEKDTMPESFFNSLRFPPNHVLKSYRLRKPTLPPETSSGVSS